MKSFFNTILYIPIYNILIFFAWLTGGSAGWAIVIITFIIRLALLPSSLKAARAQVKNLALQPKINALKQKYKGGDQKAMNEELMKLYKEENFSPLGSCLPLLIQMPIIIVLYRVILAGFDTSKYNLLYSFVPRPDVLHTAFFGIDLAKPDLWILPIIVGLSQLALSIMTMPPKQAKVEGETPDPMSMMTKQMTFILPIMMLFITRSLPAGVAIYILFTTLISIVQQWYVNKEIKGKAPKISATVGVEGVKIASEPKQIESAKEIVKKPNRTDMINDMRKRKLDKTDKKKGVEITIRKKK